MPMDFGHMVHGFTAGVDFSVVFADGHGKVFGAKTKYENKNKGINNLWTFTVTILRAILRMFAINVERFK